MSAASVSTSPLSKRYTLPINPKYAIDPYLDRIASTLLTSRSCVISAPPGTGKSTRVPPHLLRVLQPTGKIVVAQPRRLAATSLAAFVASETDSKLGEEIGYSVRFDRKTSSKTKIEFVTDGLLLRRMARDAFLEDSEIIILDEFHERSLNTDLVAAFLRELLTIRDDLKLVIMSATLSAQHVSEFFKAPVISIDVPQFENTITYLKAVPEDRQFAIAKIVNEITNLNADPQYHDKDILAFLPGKREIENVKSLINSPNVDVRTLHGSLSLKEQTRALRPSSQQRVILATNIAETSLTVPGVRIVIDSGMEKIDFIDPHTHFDHLVTQVISFASAEQRAGRAARQGNGFTFRCWTKNSEFRMPSFRTAAIQRSDITGAVLQAIKWANNIDTFQWFEKPKESALHIALRTLRAIGAIDETNNITPFGEELLDFPLSPRLAALVLHAQKDGFPREGAYAAAVLSESEFDLDQAYTDKPVRCDISRRASQLAETGKPFQIHKIACQIEKRCRERSSIDEKEIRKLLLKTFPDLFAIMRSETRYALVGGGSVFVKPRRHDRSEYLLALRAFGSKKIDGVKCSVANYVCELDKKMLKKLVKREITPIFSEKEKRLEIFEIESFYGLEISRRRASTKSADASLVSKMFAEAIARNWRKAFTVTQELEQLIARLNLLEPDFAFEDRMRDIDFLSMLVGEERAFSGTKKIDLVKQILHSLPYATKTRLNKELPAAFTTPAGRKRRIDYTVSPPVLAIRIQELFGLKTTPTLNEGRLRLRLHLLAPNNRPAQITDDLASFWENTYEEVRKELMARYPKHAWPKNPAYAQPQNK